MSSTKKTALVTGANKGIGFEIARQLAERDFLVILSGRNKIRVEEAVHRLSEKYSDIIPLVMDVGDAKSIHEAYRSVKPKVTGIDVLVNNAGILLDETKPLLKFTEEEVFQMFHTNSLGPFFVAKTFLGMMPKGGRIINISSSAGSFTEGYSGYAPLYSASKTAENALTVQLAHALQSKGIVANAVCPGWVRTDIGGPGASRSVSKGAETPVWLATEAPLTITGKFLRDKKEIAW